MPSALKLILYLIPKVYLFVFMCGIESVVETIQPMDTKFSTHVLHFPGQV